MKLPFFKFDSDAWLTGKIQCLEITEKGIFIDLIARIWHNGGSVPNDEFLHRLLRVEKDTLSEALQAFLEIGVMTEENGILRVKFIDEQISEVDDYRKQQAEFGARGGRPKKGEPKGTKANRERRNKREEEKKISPPYGGDTKEKTHTLLENPPDLPNDGYPTTVEEVLEIASRPDVAAIISREEAERYFITRQAANWIDGLGRKIAADRLGYDIKKWSMMPSQRPKNNSPTGASGHEISEEDMKVYEQYTGLHR